MYIIWGLIFGSVIIYLLYHCVIEIFDFLFNRKKLLDLLNRADEISIEHLETEIDSCLVEMKTVEGRLKSEDENEWKTFWMKNWNLGKSEWEIQKEQKIRTLFDPNK